MQISQDIREKGVKYLRISFYLNIHRVHREKCKLISNQCLTSYLPTEF